MSQGSFLYGVQKPLPFVSPLTNRDVSGMKWLFQPLLLLVARSTESELAKQVEYLKAENLMLRKRLPKRVRLTSDEKKLLVKLGQAIGTGITTLLSIVAYSTYRSRLPLFAPE